MPRSTRRGSSPCLSSPCSAKRRSSSGCRTAARARSSPISTERRRSTGCASGFPSYAPCSAPMELPRELSISTLRSSAPPLASSPSTPLPKTRPSSSTPPAPPASPREPCTRTACSSDICPASSIRTTASRNPATASGPRRTGPGSGACSTCCSLRGTTASRWWPTARASSIPARR